MSHNTLSRRVLLAWLGSLGAPALALEPLLAKSAPAGIDPKPYLVSEKFDGVRALWDGQVLKFRSGRTVTAPAWFLADFGLIGLVVFLGLCAWVLWRAVVVAPTARSLGRSGLVRGLVLSHIAMAGLSIGIEAFYQRHWWLVMGAIAALASPSTLWSDADDETSS
jgi:hypothetical protein